MSSGYRILSEPIDSSLERIYAPYAEWICLCIAYSRGTTSHIDACRGTGASAIYPLLACRMEPSWNFVATGKYIITFFCSELVLTHVPEIDSISYTYAERNIQLNQLQDRIQLMRASTDGRILFPLENYAGPP